MSMRNDKTTAGEKAAQEFTKDQRIAELENKIRVMRGLLWEWNISSGPVWEYWKLAQVGETVADYADYVDDEYFDSDDDIPLPPEQE